MLEHFVGRDKHHVVALPARFMAQRLRQVTFPNAAGPTNQHIAFEPQILTTRERQDLLPMDARIEREVKPFQRFGAREAGTAHAQRQLLLSPPFQFVFQKTRQEVHIRPLAVDRLPLPRLQGFDHARQSQALELLSHLMRQFH